MERHCSYPRKERRKEEDVGLESATAVFCLMREDSEGKEFAVLQYIECLLPLDEVDEALRCMCLQWATTASAEKEHDLERERRG